MNCSNNPQRASGHKPGASSPAHLEINASGRPEFIRLPKVRNRCAYTGLSRSKLNSLILPCSANDYRPLVKSVSLRKPGTIRGTRLIHFDDLLAYLHSHAEPARHPSLPENH